MPMPSGTDFAGYRIVRRLGSGGMGEVYVAQHPRLPRHDALKVLRPEVSTDGEFRDRFLREADLAATLSHPNIVGVYDRGTFDDQLWISMEYVDGTDVSRLLADAGQVPDDQVATIITAVAEALDYAHQRNLLHRDVKPANILIGGDDPANRRIKLADFGIARRTDESAGLTATNMTVGTVSYAAPEQLTGSALDGRADQYALAATAFHLLTGAPPFANSNPAVVIGQHLTAPRPSLSQRRPDLAALDPVLARALAKDPKDRFDRCADFARALQHQLGVTGTDSTTLAPAAQTAATEVMQPTKAGRSRVSVLLLVALSVLLLVAIGLAAFEFHRAKEEQPAPQQPAKTAISTTATTTTTTTTSQPSVVPAPPGPAESTVTDTVTNTVTDTTTSSPAPDTNTTTSTATTATEPPPEQESPIRECMQQTGMTRLQCWESIRRDERRR